MVSPCKNAVSLNLFSMRFNKDKGDAEKIAIENKNTTSSKDEVKITEIIEPLKSINNENVALLDS